MMSCKNAQNGHGLFDPRPASTSIGAHRIACRLSEIGNKSFLGDCLCTYTGTVQSFDVVCPCKVLRRNPALGMEEKAARVCLSKEFNVVGIPLNWSQQQLA